MWAEGGVGGYCYALFLGQGDQTGLGEVGVVFNLQGGGLDFGVAEKIHDELAVEIADADAFGQAFSNKSFHCCPGFLDCGGAGDDFLAVIGEAGGITVFGVDVL